MSVFYAESDELYHGAVCAINERHIEMGDFVRESNLLFDGQKGELTESFWIAGLIRHFLDRPKNLFVIYPKGKCQGLFGSFNQHA